MRRERKATTTTPTSPIIRQPGPIQPGTRSMRERCRWRGGAPPIDWKSAANTLRPMLNPGWLSIGMRIGYAVAATACAASPVGCAALAVFVIVVLIIVACVLEIGGPCWLSRVLEQTETRRPPRVDPKPNPIPAPQPGPTPPPAPIPNWDRDDQEIDSCKRAATSVYLRVTVSGLYPHEREKVKRRHGPGGSSNRIFKDLSRINEIVAQTLSEGVVTLNVGQAKCRATMTFPDAIGTEGERTVVVLFDDVGNIYSVYPSR